MISKEGALSFTAILLSSVYPCSSLAQDSEKTVNQDNIWSMLDPRISGDIRLRYQNLDSDSFPETGEALTLRFLGTLEAKIFDKTYILGEVEGVTAFIDEYDDGSGQSPLLPFIPDPEGVELNRLQLITEVVPKTRITAGRQRVALDDSRFIGAFPFRQNGQTIDAIRVENKALGRGVLDVGYFNKVHRPLGADSPKGVFEGDSFYVNYNVGTPIGRFSAFHYAADLETDPLADTPLNASSKTTGARVLGRRDWDDFSLVWEASYAQQSDYADSPIDYKADYALLELSVKPGSFDFRVRGELLGTDNGFAVQTPLGSLHKFQGFTDKFFTTPGEGVRDYSVLARYRFGAMGPFSNVETFARHHWFEADSDGRSYGRELDLSIKAKLNKTGLALEYANYKADSFSSDTQALFLTTEISF